MHYGNRVCLVAALLGHALFLLLLIVFMLARLFREKLITIDNIMAGIIVYLLMAGLWTQLYGLVLLHDPGSINIPGGLGPYPFLTLYYFSVTTLTTAGFGDVAPLSTLARILSAYESCSARSTSACSSPCSWAAISPGARRPRPRPRPRRRAGRRTPQRPGSGSRRSARDRAGPRCRGSARPRPRPGTRCPPRCGPGSRPGAADP